MNTHTFRFAVVAVILLASATRHVPSLEAAGPGVHGRVLGHDAEGRFVGIVAGAKIEFLSGQSSAGQTVSDANGYYKVEISPGDYTYRIVAEGYRTEDSGRGFRLTNSQGFAVFNLAVTKGEDEPDRKPPVRSLTQQGRLSGRVVFESREGQTGIGNAEVTLRLEGTATLRTVTTRSVGDEMHPVGSFEIQLPVGIWHAHVAARGFDPLTDAEPIVIEDKGSSERTFVLSRSPVEEATGQGISGIVVAADSGHRERPGISVSIQPLTGGEIATVQVGDKGEFSQELSPGSYRVTARAEGFPDASSRPVYVFAGQYSTVRLMLRAESVPPPETHLDVLILGKVSDKQAANPLSGAAVSLLRQGADAATAQSAETDATGHAVLIPESAGTYQVDAHAEGFEPGSVAVTVVSGEPGSIILELKKAVTPSTQYMVDVTVTDAVTKRPIRGARILARQESQSLSSAARSVTNDAGVASLTVSKIGTCVILAQAVGFQPKGDKLTIMADRPKYSLHLVMEPVSRPPDTVPEQPDSTEQPPGTTNPPTAPLSVAGFVAFRDPTGALRGVKGAKLIWERIQPAQPPMTRFAVSSDNGKYEIEVQKGVHQVRIEPPAGFSPLTETVTIQADGATKYFIVVRSDGTPPGSQEKLVDVAGIVVGTGPGTRDVSVSNASLVFSRSAGSIDVTTDLNGAFRVQLPADSYRVLVRAKGFEPLESRAQVVAGMEKLRLVLKRTQQPQQDFRLNLTVIQNAGRLGYGPAKTIAGAVLTISGPEQRETRGVSGRNGQYFVRLLPGTYSVRVSKDGFKSEARTIRVVNQDVSEQIALTPVETQPSQQSTLTVQVLEYQEPAPRAKALPVPKPIPGAKVTIIRGSQQVASGTTSGQGEAIFKLATGEYSIKAVATGFGTGGKAVSLSNQNLKVTISLTKTPSGKNLVVPPGLRRNLRLPDAGLKKIR